MNFEQIPKVQPVLGRSVGELLAEHLEIKDNLHHWLPGGLTLLGGKTKSGKSTLAEQIAADISITENVLYLALEYNLRMAQGRFASFSSANKVHIVLEGEINRIGKGGERQLENLIRSLKPKLLIIDILAKLKRQNMGSYDAEYQAMTEIKELVDKYDMDCLVLTHSGKPTANDSDDPFDKIIGSTALQGVPDNLMVLSQRNAETTLQTKGRLIFPSKKILSFKDGKYKEKTGAGAEIQERAPLKSKILDLIEKHEELRVSELADMLQRTEPQISEACKTLSNEGYIYRDDRTQPYRLVKLLL